jgi:hypothetical protein
MHLGTLADGQGCFPLGNEAYPSLPVSHILSNGIRSLVGFGGPVSPLVHPVLYLRYCPYEAIPKYVSRRTSYHRV